MRFSYPRPQLERTQWQSLDGRWQFAFDRERRFSEPADIVNWPLAIEVPYPPESSASGIGDTGYHEVCWYQREFSVTVPSGKRVLLHFGAVDYAARVWVNGRLVATHEGGHTPFWADVTFALNDTGPQTVTVMASDDPLDLTKPRGKQDWQLEPHSIWYPRTSGIWQTVWLECVSATFIEKVRWTPCMDNYALQFEARIAGLPHENLTIDLTLSYDGRMLARDSYAVIDREADRRLIFSDPGIDDYRNEILWSPEHPALIDAHVRLRCGDEVLDEFNSYAALRSVEIMRGRFMLNGRPFALRMVLDQGYWPATLLAPPDDDALKCDVELAKAMGFNGVRKHQKIEHPRYLYWADKLGLLVWEEMPSAYRFTRTAVRRTVREWSEAIDRDFSHPCIIAWVPYNESWGVPELPNVKAHRHAVEALYHLTKTLDPTRPVIGNDGWESGATDMIGIHDYEADPARMRERYGRRTSSEELFDRRQPAGRVLTLDGYPHRGQPIILTEFGGIAFGESAVDRSKAWGYSKAESPDEYRRHLESLLRVVTQSPLLSGFCYTQFADTFQEVNGLLTAERQPKIPLAEIRRLVLLGYRNPPF